MKRIITFLLAIVLCGCSKVSVVQKTPQSFTPTEITFATTTNTPTLPPTATPSLTATTIPFIKISSLPPGEYLSYLRSFSGEDTYYVGVLSPDGESKGYLAKVEISSAQLSPNLEYVTDYQGVINLNSGERLHFDELNDCDTGDWSWSPDSQSLVVSCSATDPPTYVPHDSLFIFSIRDHSMLRITNNPDSSILSSPSWSPDGRWIAYTGITGRSGTSYYNGFHILDTRCFSSPVTCWRDEPAMNVNGPYVWSPDSRFLAAGSGIYHVFNGVVTLWRKYPIDPTSIIEWLSWSPNSNQIAMMTNLGNFLLSVDTNKTSSLIVPAPAPPLNWFYIP